jgi:hypothetical protein
MGASVPLWMATAEAAALGAGAAKITGDAWNYLNSPHAEPPTTAEVRKVEEARIAALRATIARQKAAADGMVANSGVKPWTPKP